MAGLTDKAGGDRPRNNDAVEKAHQAWQESMTRHLKLLREKLREKRPKVIANTCGGAYEDGSLHLTYWEQPVFVPWPELEAYHSADGSNCPTFDTAMLLYYFSSADGAGMADSWIGFRELPNGGFYHRAFQGYSGDQLALTFGDDPAAFNLAARALNGWPLPAISPHAFAFLPLPRIRLAAVLWPGDDEFPAKASVLFDGAASHYMTTDGLALLGAGLVRRLIHATQNS